MVLTYGKPLEHIELVLWDIIAWLGKRSKAAGCPVNARWEKSRCAEPTMMAAEGERKVTNDSLS